MKKLMLVLVVFMVLSACAKQSVVPVTTSTPAPRVETKIVVDQVALREFREKWPVITTAEQAKALGLHLTVLTNPLDVLNLQNKEKENPWKWETLKVGTKVWSDGNDIPRYKADCLNLLYVPTTTITKSIPVAPIVVVTPLVKKGFWARFWANLWGLPLALLILLLLFLLSLLVWRQWPWRVTRQLIDEDPILPTMGTILSSEPKLRKGTSASAPIIPTAPAPKPVTPATSGTTWSINASRNVSGKIRFESDGFDHVSISSSDEKPSIKAFRR